MSLSDLEGLEVKSEFSLGLTLEKKEKRKKNTLVLTSF
jgi:hypothetical protein